MEAYDAAVIGAGAEGLAAAITLARAGLSCIVLERNAEPGGRCRTFEFHDGFRASLTSDEIAPIPREIFTSFGLAAKGVFFVPAAATSSLWPDRCLSVSMAESSSALGCLWREALAARTAIRGQASFCDRPRRRLFSAGENPVWPGEDWARTSLFAFLSERLADPDFRAHALALALEGRAADPALNGTALHLLAPPSGSGMVRGGLGSLGGALAARAQEAGASIRCGLEVTDIRHSRDRVSGVVLVDGTEISAPIVVSTLDFRRTFLSLFKWENLRGPAAERARVYRYAGATARLLLALERLPEGLPAGAARGVIAIAPEVGSAAASYASWRAGSLPAASSAIVRFPSALDPALAPESGVTMSVTLGGAPHRFFDGGWTHARREELSKRILASIDSVLPGTSARVLGSKLIVPSDIEEAIGRTDGDLAGGEIVADQMLGMRPWAQPGLDAPHTPFHGLFIAGPSTTLGLVSTCASGVLAARAAIASNRRGWFR